MPLHAETTAAFLVTIAECPDGALGGGRPRTTELLLPEHSPTALSARGTAESGERPGDRETYLPR